MAEHDPPPEWTEERRRAFREALRARQERQVRAGRGFALGLVALVAAGVLLRLPEAWWVPAVGAVALGGVVFRMANWKCPSCGERLPTRGGSTCRGCGMPLDE
jgi:fatty acid desaturase